MQDEYNAKLNLIKKYMLDLKSMSDSSRGTTPIDLNSMSNSSTVLETTGTTPIDLNSLDMKNNHVEHSDFASLFMEVNANVYHTNQKIACMKLLINKIKELRNELRLMREHM